MTQERDLPVLVGVDGSEESLLAVRYGVDAAHRAGCGLQLAHAVPEVVPMTPMLPLVGVETLEETGRRILRTAHRAADRFGDGTVPVEESMRIGSRVHFLDMLSEHARLLVVGHRRRSGVGRVLTASTTTGVATRAHCPVVCVPPTWAPEKRHGCVLVGVEDCAHAVEPLTTAFRAASERRARLTVVHAWKLPSPYDDIVVARTHGEEWQRETSRQLAEAMAALREEFPEVHVEVDVRHETPATALTEASRRADLLVVGRHGHGGPLGFRLGSVTRALLREASCPVEVVPRHGVGEDLSGLELTESEASPQF